METSMVTRNWAQTAWQGEAASDSNPGKKKNQQQGKRERTKEGSKKRAKKGDKDGGCAVESMENPQEQQNKIRASEFGWAPHASSCKVSQRFCDASQAQPHQVLQNFWRGCGTTRPATLPSWWRRDASIWSSEVGKGLFGSFFHSGPIRECDLIWIKPNYQTPRPWELFRELRKKRNGVAGPLGLCFESKEALWHNRLRRLQLSTFLCCGGHLWDASARPRRRSHRFKFHFWSNLKSKTGFFCFFLCIETWWNDPPGNIPYKARSSARAPKTTKSCLVQALSSTKLGSHALTLMLN